MMTFTATMLLAVTLISSPEALVLRSGERIAVDGNVSLAAGSYVFRSGGTLYSLPEREVDVEATNRVEASRRAALEHDRSTGPVKMRATPEQREKIFEKLNNTATSSSPAPRQPAAPSLPPVPQPPPRDEPSPAEQKQEERYWREESRRHHQDVERWREELAFLERREQKLEDEILMLMNLGYKSREFSREVLQLELTREGQERAQMELARAERALQQFLTDARREGILPGWLR